MKKIAPLTLLCLAGALHAAERPNILIAISDDQSYPHASAYGAKFLSTPAFDRVAKAGVLFTQAFTPAPGCSPMRAAFLTGRHIWQIEEAGTHASSFPAKYKVFPDVLEQAGYRVGCTGKAWGPRNWKASGRPRNPAGDGFNRLKLKPPAKGIRNTDYAGNFEAFLKDQPEGKPFCFWYGSSEPHRGFEKGVGLKNGMDPSKVDVPGFLPDTPEIRSDILDYGYEIQWFDKHLGRMLDLLAKRGELENTLVIVTSDNGMAFPRAKANVYEYGIHMPLAIAWPAKVPGGRTVDDLVDLIDVTATIYQASGVPSPKQNPIAGRGLMDLLASEKSGRVDEFRDAIYSGRERHSSSRYMTLSYPQRCIRTHRYLYIRNFKPERWPAGTPQKYGKGGYPKRDEVLNKVLGPEHGGYHDIDACPSLDFLIKHRNDPKIAPYFHAAVDRRPAEELYDIVDDPACMKNLAEDETHFATKRRLAERLTGHLKDTGDRRVTGEGDVWETYPRYSGVRFFPEPDWAKKDPSAVPAVPWLEQRRPK